MLREKKQAKKEFRRAHGAVRIELAKLRNEEKENIPETRTKDTKMFHKLVRKNKRQGNDMIMELEVIGKNCIESENIINGFQEHFSSLATFNHRGSQLYFHITRYVLKEQGRTLFLLPKVKVEFRHLFSLQKLISLCSSHKINANIVVFC